MTLSSLVFFRPCPLLCVLCGLRFSTSKAVTAKGAEEIAKIRKENRKNQKTFSLMVRYRLGFSRMDLISSRLSTII